MPAPSGSDARRRRRRRASEPLGAGNHELLITLGRGEQGVAAIDHLAGGLEGASARQEEALDGDRRTARARIVQAEVVEGLQIQPRSGRMHRMGRGAPGMFVERDETVQRMAHQADIAGPHGQLPVQAVGDMTGDRPGWGAEAVGRSLELGLVMGVEKQRFGAEPALQHLAEGTARAFGDVHEEQRLGGVQIMAAACPGVAMIASLARADEPGKRHGSAASSLRTTALTH